MQTKCQSALRRIGAIVLTLSVLFGHASTAAYANYTQKFKVEDAAKNNYTAVWKSGKTFAPERVNYSSKTVANMMEEIEKKDLKYFHQNDSNLPWIDRLLVNEGVIPDDAEDDQSANTLFSRGSALYMRSQDPSELGFVGEPFYADTLNQSALFRVDLGAALKEQTNQRKNYPSHETQTFNTRELKVHQKKFITYGNTAVALYEFINKSSSPITFTMTVKSPFTTKASGEDELFGYRVAAPLMIKGGSSLDTVEAMSYVDVYLSADGMKAENNTLTKSITIPAGKSVDEKVVMGWLAEEIPQSKTDYDWYKKCSSNEDAYQKQVETYNEWWADNIPYIDIPDKNVKKVLYYRWWCNRFNLLDANIPGNDWQFPMNMEGVLGYNNGITVSVPWALQDLKWLRDPSYAYGTWLAQGEYSGDSNYKNNPGRPGVWTWDMMQNTSQVGWEAYKIHGGGDKILKKFADFAKNDVFGSLSTFHADGYDNLISYNHGPITGNDGDCVGMHWNTKAGGKNYVRVDGSSTVYANAVAAAKMYRELGDKENAEKMQEQADAIRKAMLTTLWYDGNDFKDANGKTDGLKDTNGEGSFLHRQVKTDLLNPYRDNNMFAFSFGVAPNALEKAQFPDYKKYATQLKDYGDPDYYPIFPFYTADQNSIKKRINDFLDGKEEMGTDQFAWCNFGNYINILRSSMRYYPVENINADVYKKLFDWGAWLHTVNAGNTDYLDSNEFFWMTDYFFGDVDNYTKENPPKISGDIVRSWIHHDTLGMMNYTVMEDMAGLQPRADDKIELWPVGIKYDYFTVDNIKYHDKNLSIVWQNPKKSIHYSGIPVGFSLFIDGKRVLTTNEMSHVIYDPKTGKAELPKNDVAGAVGNNSKTKILFEAGTATPVATAEKTNLADNAKVADTLQKAGIDIVNDNENLALTAEVTASYIEPDSDIEHVKDGSTVTAGGQTISDAEKVQHTALFKDSPNATDTIDFRFEKAQNVDNVKLYFYNDRIENGYGTPQSYNIEYWDEKAKKYKPVIGQFRQPVAVASNYNNAAFKKVNTSRIRVSITHSPEVNTGVKEIQIFYNHVENQIPKNKAPVISPISAQTAKQGQPLEIAPRVSDATLPNGVLTYQWKITKAPEGAQPEILEDSETAPILNIKFSQTGDYTLHFTVSDGEAEASTDISVSVGVDTEDLSKLMAKFQNITSNAGTIKRNSKDFTKDSWETLQTELKQAEKLLKSASYSEEEITEQTQKLQDAMDALVYVNVGLLAEPTANYTPSWESISAVNDGFSPISRFAETNSATGEKLQWGNWGSGQTTNTVTYTWDSPVTIQASDLYFYDDDGGTLVPASYTLSYYAPDNEKADKNGFVTLKKVNLSKDSDRTAALGTFIQDEFEEISTTALRVQLENRTANSYSGIKEWRVLGSSESNEPIDPEPVDPTPKKIQQIKPETVETFLNTMPGLPEEVTVVYEDGTTALVAVTWNDVPKDKLSVATSFNVLGTVAETELPAICTINVRFKQE